MYSVGVVFQTSISAFWDYIYIYV